MITRTTLGSSGLIVSAMGLGCMGMSESYGAADWDGGLATIDRALELGVTFLDTADAYGTGHRPGRPRPSRPGAGGHQVRHRPQRRRPGTPHPRRP
ncbi:hypothetical protein GCM10023192_34060 [Amycolatopsis samaneae]